MGDKVVNQTIITVGAILLYLISCLIYAVYTLDTAYQPVENNFILWFFFTTIFFAGYSIYQKLLANRYTAPDEFWKELEEPEGNTPIRKEHLLIEWWNHQKQQFKGPLIKLPEHPLDFEVISQVEGSLFEVEADAEHYIIDKKTSFVPWTRRSRVTFYTEPISVPLPDTYINTSYSYALQDSLEKRICNECGGDGTVVCSRCRGRGEVNCSFCNGRGYNRRSRTDSDGDTEWYNDDCSFCFNGDVTCSHCRGKGIVICPKCDGDGDLAYFIVKTWEFIHWIRPIVILQEQGEVREADIPNLPNREALELKEYSLEALNTLDKQFPDRAEIHKRLKEESDQLVVDATSLQNYMFHKLNYRFMPKLTIDVNYENHMYTLVGRGYYPMNQTISKLPVLPISKLRLGLLFTIYFLGQIFLFNF